MMLRSNILKVKKPRVTNLATIAAFTSVENISYLVKKESRLLCKKIRNTSDYNKFTINILHANVTQRMLPNESDLDEKTKTLAIKEEVKTLAMKVELKAEKDKLVKLQTYDLIIFIGQSSFGFDGAQNY